MNPAAVSAAIAVSLRAGRSDAEIMQDAIRAALVAYKARKEGSQP